ncbi:unnamed protein product [Arabidopsis arenosa]|uniref:NYN domain-containing protein n=1 Tax=Arabidopsis arenosa TaxID=38785 RepID=A0A8S2AP20_ARAAE|nr:unnamed protein product [Arabidopsis arenosa]
MDDSSKSRFYGAKTIVFWQFEECPIPDDIISDEVEANISSAIRDMGYYGPLTVRAYGDIYKLQRECCGFLIFYATSETTQDKILVDLLGQAVFRSRDSPLNLMLILGDISRHAGLLRAIRVLVSHGNFNVILTQPQEVAFGQLPDGVDTVWLWESLAVQARMVSRDSGPAVSTEELSNIRSALENLNYRGTSSIYAYGDMNQIKAGLENTRFVVKQHKPAEEAHKEYLGTTSICDTEDLVSPDIVVNDTPLGDKHARLEKIIIDSFSWALDNPTAVNLMFILGDISSDHVFISALYNLDAAKYKVLLAQPAFASKAPPVVRAKWLWECLSAGGDPIVDDQTESDDSQFEYVSDMNQLDDQIESSQRLHNTS